MVATAFDEGERNPTGLWSFVRLHGSAHFLVQISEFITNHHIMRAHDSLSCGFDRVAFLSNLLMKVLTLSGPDFYGVPGRGGGRGGGAESARGP